ncbi:hypothetical protein, partial [Burkholderia pseudomallei]|uniref:hypothetical protein n=1 Tax=Burkholderia pseudomallei TaxID=28450 RepID=UPI0038B371E3
MTADFDARFRGRLQRSIAHGSNRVRTRFHSASDGIASLRLAACGLRLAACGGKSSVKRVRYRRSAARRHASGNWPSRRRPVHSPSIPANSPRIGGTRRASRGPCFHGAASNRCRAVRVPHDARRAG